MKIIDSNDNTFICKIGSPLHGIKLKKVYLWDDELEIENWCKYKAFLESKFIDRPFIKVNQKINTIR